MRSPRSTSEASRPPLLRRLVRRVLAGTAVGALAGAVLAQTVSVAMPASEPAAAASSAVTVSGRGEFKDMRFTVSQTRNLASQALKVSWTGGTPTTVAGSQFNTDFVQLMQCWGDDDKSVPENPGPPRTQCQFGASPTTGRGSWPGNQYDDTRQVFYSAAPSRYGQDREYGAGMPFGRGEVPFKSVDGELITSDTQNNPLFSYNTTNEIGFGRTGSDGTGTEFFEAQTKNEAPHLGCGAPVKHPDGTVSGRSCWLVIVPQGHLNLDGEPYQDTTQVNAGSPVSSTNWRNRIAVKLDFNPVGVGCAMGAEERDTTGSELVSDAMNSWQAALCSTGTVYGYTTVGDPEARDRLADNGTTLVFSTRPVTGPTKPEDPLTYAPTALSGAVIGFSIERQPRSNAPADVKKRAGTRVESLDLTPRMVAKLLTESYRNSPWSAVRSEYVNGTSKLVAAKGYGWALNNPTGLVTDPEFVKRNPEFADLTVASNPSTDTDLITALGHTDAAAQVWDWVLSDHEARQFLAGVPDDWGMRVNPYFSTNADLNPNGVAFTPERDDFPKSDKWSVIPPGSEAEIPQTMTDFHPYVDDLHSGALRTRRADQLWKSNWDALATPPAWKSPGPQIAGQRFMLTVTDAASAARYGLQTARLRNAAGEFTAPSAGALAAAAAKAPVKDGVRRIDPAAKVKGAYPLAMVVYGAARPAKLTAEARKQYAALLTYAAAEGQSTGTAPGNLPAGYAPLPAAFRTEARKAVQELVSWKPAKGESGPEESAGSSGGTGEGTDGDGAGNDGGAAESGAGATGSAGSTGTGSTGATGATGGSAPGAESTPGAAPSGSAVPASGAGPVIGTGVQTLAGGITPGDPAAALRYAVPIGAGLGLLAAVAAPFVGGQRLPLRVKLPGGRTVTVLPRLTLPARLRALRLPGR
ncbi:hypothetical protein [Streptomyces sp. NPDC088725]|uniref:hypothetical protein n=1 Tax=Streptomyces sp. NPDC088725 TaxID=3365873 RepID=UPI003811ED4A